MFTALAGGVNLGEWGLKRRPINVSFDSRLYLEHRTAYTLRVTKVPPSKVLLGSSPPDHKDRLHMAKMCFLLEVFHRGL